MMSTPTSQNNVGTHKFYEMTELIMRSVEKGISNGESSPATKYGPPLC
jgi:hypothetical protein